MMLLLGYNTTGTKEIKQEIKEEIHVMIHIYIQNTVN